MNQLVRPYVELAPRRGLARLTDQLHALERGETPSAPEVLRALAEVADRPPACHREQAVDLCLRLGAFVDDLLEDGLELSLEDLDVLFDGSHQLEAWSTGQRPQVDLVQRVEHPSQEVLDSCSLRFEDADHGLPSGLRIREEGEELRVVVPPLDAPGALERVLDDLEGLNVSMRSSQAWRVDCSRLERIPLAFVAALVRMAQGDGDESRRIAVAGGLVELQSQDLYQRLGRVLALE